MKPEFVALLWNMLPYCKGHHCLHLLYYCDLCNYFAEKYFLYTSFSDSVSIWTVKVISDNVIFRVFYKFSKILKLQRLHSAQADLTLYYVRIIHVLRCRGQWHMNKIFRVLDVIYSETFPWALFGYNHVSCHAAEFKQWFLLLNVYILLFLMFLTVFVY